MAVSRSIVVVVEAPLEVGVVAGAFEVSVQGVDGVVSQVAAAPLRTDANGWYHIADGLPPDQEDVLICWANSGRVMQRRIVIKDGEPRWGRMGGGNPLTAAPWWRFRPEMPEGLPEKVKKEVREGRAARVLRAAKLAGVVR